MWFRQKFILLNIALCFYTPSPFCFSADTLKESQHDGIFKLKWPLRSPEKIIYQIFYEVRSFMKLDYTTTWIY